jgi:hypothetical protein
VISLGLFLLAGGSSLTGFGTLGAVAGTALTTLIDAEAVKGAADDVVANAGKVANAAATNENDRVFLEVVAFAADVSGDFFAVGEANAANFTESGVGLLGGAGHDLSADAAALGAGFEGARLGFGRLLGAALANELIDGGHLDVSWFSGRLGKKASHGSASSTCVKTGEALS